METKLYKELAARINARNNCRKHASMSEWENKHSDVIRELIDTLSHGSGIDSEWALDDKTTDEKLILHNSYHRMNDMGGYAGWIDFTVTITASLLFDFSMVVTGNFGKHQDIKEYLADTLHSDFNQMVEVTNENGVRLTKVY